MARPSKGAHATKRSASDRQEAARGRQRAGGAGPLPGFGPRDPAYVPALHATEPRLAVSALPAQASRSSRVLHSASQSAGRPKMCSALSRMQLVQGRSCRRDIRHRRSGPAPQGISRSSQRSPQPRVGRHDRLHAFGPGRLVEEARPVQQHPPKVLLDGLRVHQQPPQPGHGGGGADPSAASHALAAGAGLGGGADAEERGQAGVVSSTALPTKTRLAATGRDERMVASHAAVDRVSSMLSLPARSAMLFLIV